MIFINLGTIKIVPNSTFPKVAVQLLNHPENMRDCASIKVCGILAVKCLEIATFVCKTLYI